MASCQIDTAKPEQRTVNYGSSDGSLNSLDKFYPRPDEIFIPRGSVSAYRLIASLARLGYKALRKHIFPTSEQTLEYV